MSLMKSINVLHPIMQNTDLKQRGYSTAFLHRSSTTVPCSFVYQRIVCTPCINAVILQPYCLMILLQSGKNLKPLRRRLSMKRTTVKRHYSSGSLSLNDHWIIIYRYKCCDAFTKWSQVYLSKRVIIVLDQFDFHTLIVKTWEHFVQLSCFKRSIWGFRLVICVLFQVRFGLRHVDVMVKVRIRG